MSADVGELGLIPGWGRSPGGGHGNALQCSCLENEQRSLVGYSPQGCKELDTTEQLSMHTHREGNLEFCQIIRIVKLVKLLLYREFRAVYCLTAGTVACQVLLSSTISQSLLKLTSIESMMLSNHPTLIPSAYFPHTCTLFMYIVKTHRSLNSHISINQDLEKRETEPN